MIKNEEKGINNITLLAGAGGNKLAQGKISHVIFACVALGV